MPGFVKCYYLGCESNNKIPSKCSYYHFPVKDRKRCKEWITNSGQGKFIDLPDNILKNRRICSNHFDRFYFMNDLRQRLTKIAVPVPYGSTPTDDPGPRLLTEGFTDSDAGTNGANETSCVVSTSANLQQSNSAGVDGAVDASPSEITIKEEVIETPFETVFCSDDSFKVLVKEEIKEEDDSFYSSSQSLLLPKVFDETVYPIQASSNYSSDLNDDVRCPTKRSGAGGNISSPNNSPKIVQTSSNYSLVNPQPSDRTIYPVQTSSKHSPVRPQPSDETFYPDQTSSNNSSSPTSNEDIIRPTKRPSFGADTSFSNKKPRMVFVRCKICVNQFFSSSADLKEHCSILHAGRSKQTYQPEPGGLPVKPTDHPDPPPPEKPPAKQYPGSGDLKTILMSLTKIPLYKRKAIQEKLQELIDFVADEDVNPSSVKFYV